MLAAGICGHTEGSTSSSSSIYGDYYDNGVYYVHLTSSGKIMYCCFDTGSGTVYDEEHYALASQWCSANEGKTITVIDNDSCNQYTVTVSDCEAGGLGSALKVTFSKY